jgi:hypothetical protein
MQLLLIDYATEDLAGDLELAEVNIKTFAILKGRGIFCFLYI